MDAAVHEASVRPSARFARGPAPVSPPPERSRRIDGGLLRVDLRSNVVVATPGGIARVRGSVAEFLAVLLTCHPNPASRRKIIKGLWPKASMQPVDVDNTIRGLASRVREALGPLGFTVLSVKIPHADVPCAYQLARMTPGGATRGPILVPAPKGLEP